jgi:hypothetical protein
MSTAAVLVICAKDLPADHYEINYCNNVRQYIMLHSLALELRVRLLLIPHDILYNIII